MRPLFAIASLLCLSLSGCGHPFGLGAPASSDPLPLHAGALWSFRTQTNTADGTYTGVSSLRVSSYQLTTSGETATLVRQSDLDVPGGTPFDGQGAWSVTKTAGALTISESGANASVALPLQVGVSWTLNGRTATLSTLDDVAVPYGDYPQTYRIDEAPSQGQGVTITRWIAPGVGVVRELRQATLTDGSQIEALYELTTVQ